MTYETLTQSNFDAFLAYMRRAFSEDPEEMMTDTLDEDAVRTRFADPFHQHTHSILALDGQDVVGRIEYHFYGCLQDGYRMAYVDWVYVLPSYRRKGIASALFRAFEKDCRSMCIDQYFLLCSDDEAAAQFYRRFDGAEMSASSVLRKNVR